MRVAHWLETLCALGGISHRGRRVRQRRRVTSSQSERLEDRVLLTNWVGDIPNGTVWPAGVVQRITGDVHIPLGSTLTIQPGAVIKFNNSSDIDFIVDGTLLAQGTAAQPIVFTELRDDTGGDTNGDGTASGPSPRNWGALIIQPGSTGSILNHFELRYGGWRADAGLVVNGGQLTFTDGVVRDADGYGVRILNASPTLTNISYIHNGFAAVSMDLKSAPVISGVTMTNNVWNGLWLDSGTLPGNATWNNPDIVYILPDDLTVPQGKTLTLGAGQIIKTGFRTELFVNGTLLANGTTAAPVIFANPSDDTAGGDTNNNGSANNASSDASGGIVFSNTSTGNALDHVEVRHSGFDYDAAIMVNGSSITLTNSVIRNSMHAGIRLASSTAVITGNVFQDNTWEPIVTDLASSLTANGNTLSHNGMDGVLMLSGTLPADATWNNPDIVYFLQQDITVPQGKTLTIGAGQIIKSGFRTELFVDGTLVVNGTAAKPVIFASPSDDTAGGDTNMNGPTSPNSDPSGGIVFSATSSGSVLDHVEVRHSGFDDNAAIMVNGASITLTNSVIRDAVHAGIWMNAGTMSISNTDFQRNTWLAIAADVASNVTSGGGNTFSQNPVNGVVVLSGTVPANRTWNNPDITYVFDGNGAGVTIPVGVTLTLGPGQIIKVTNQREAFIVNGTLKALGTVAAPVICTSFDDDSVGGDSNNNGAASAPGPGNWKSWSFRESSTNSVLDYVELRYGNDGESGARPGMLNVTGSELTITNSVFTRSNNVAIGARADSELTLINNLIVNNASGAGVHISAASQLVAINNTIDGNGWGVIVDGVGSIAELTNNLITNNGRAGIVRSNLAVVDAQFNDVFNPTAVDGNYVGLASLTGVNGNLAANPMYVNRAGLDFHLLAGSPAIDAGTSEGAPVDDRDFNFRTDNPAVVNTGAGSPPFYDLGAYESAGRPRAVKSTPSGDVAGMVSEVVLTFREAMDKTSFSPAADVISFTGPNGPLAVTGFQWINKYQLAVKFNTLSKAGPYELLFGPGILNANSQALDTDGDGTRGEGVQDRYAATWTLTPPRVEAHAPADYVPLTADHVSFTFDREMDQQSFSLSDIVSFMGPNGAIPVTGFTWTDLRTLRVNFDAQTTLGYYEMMLGSNIASLGGDLLDQNGNHVGGEASDTYSAGFTLAQIFHVSGNISQSTTWAGLVIVDANVTIQSGVTITIAPGTIVKLQDLTSITVASGGTLLSNGTVAQPVIITSIHDDSVGGDTDANGNRRGPQAGDWISIHLNGGTGQFESTHILHGGGSATGSWNNSGMIKTSGSANLTISRSVVRDALFDGVLVQGGLASITNTIIAGTDRGVSSGLATANVQVINSTIVDNRIGLLGHSGILNVVNSIVSHNLQFGIDNDIDPDPTVSFTDIFNPGATNTRGFTNSIGSNGNISVDPQFVNPETGNYRLNFGSPAIDAANGGSAPTTDQSGAPRYDDPRTANTGTITGNNAFADMGAFEFVEGAPSDLDLIVTTTSVSVTGAVQGDEVTINWQVKNTGAGIVAGAWHDAVYLSTDPVLSPDDLPLGTALHTGSLGPNQTYSGTADVTIPGALPGSYYLLVRTNSDNAVFEGRNVSNNVTASGSTIDLQVPVLTVGGSISGHLEDTGDFQVFQLVVPAGADVTVSVDGAKGAVNELYAMADDVPTRQSFDARGNVANQSDQALQINSASGGTYYILVYGASAAEGESFTLTAELSTFSIGSVSPLSGGNAGNVTITIAGTQFNSSSQPKLVDSANHSILPSHVYFTDSETLSATFNLTGAAIGPATVQVTNSGNVAATSPVTFQIVAGEVGHLVTSITAPSQVRIDRNYIAYITYTNVGGADLLAPMFRIVSDHTSMGLTPERLSNNPQHVIEIIGINPDGPAGVLPPGATGRIAIYCRTPAAGNEQLVVETVNLPSTPIDFAAAELFTPPADMSQTEWLALINQLELQIGTTWSDYAAALSRDATLMTPSLFGLNYSVPDVFAFEVDQARAALHTSVSGTLTLTDVAAGAGGSVIVLVNQDTGLTYSTASRTDGKFVFADIDVPGTYDVFVDHYLLDSPVEITIGTSDINGFNITARPAGTISGNVLVAGTGAAVPNELVVAYSDDGTLYTGTSASDGSYTIGNLPPGTYIVRAGDGPYVEHSVDDVAVGLSQQVRHVNVGLSVGASLSGKITGPGGAVAGARVTVYGADGVAVGQGEVSSSTGNYLVTGIPEGQYTVQASADGLASARLFNVAFTSGGTLTNQNLTLVTGGRATGSVVSQADGTPISDAIITVTAGNVGVAVTNSLDDGAFSISDLAPGSYSLKVSLPGYVTTTVTVVIVATQDTAIAPIQLQSAGSVQGTVTQTAGGSTVSGLNVDVWSNGEVIAEATTDSAGEYSITDLPFGTYLVTVGSDSAVIIASQSITVSAATPAATVDFDAPVIGSISGTLFESDGVTPVALGFVTLIRGSAELLTAVSDDDGHYQFYLTEPGTYEVEAVTSGGMFVKRNNLVVTTGTELSNVDLLAGTALVTGIVRNAATGQPVINATVLVSGPGIIATQVINTDLDGRYQFSGPTGAQLQVVASSGTLSYAMSAVTLVANTTITLDFSLGAGSTLSGVITDSTSGLPVADATVFVRNLVGTDVEFGALTDAQGAYSIGGLQPGSYAVVVMDGTHQTAVLGSVTVSGAATQRNVPLSAANNVVTGIVRDASGNPLADTPVRAENAAGDTVAEAVSAADGTYTLTTIPAGTFTLIAGSPGMGEVQLPPITVTAGGQLSAQNFQLVPVAASQDAFALQAAAASFAPFARVLPFPPSSDSTYYRTEPQRLPSEPLPPLPSGPICTSVAIAYREAVERIRIREGLYNAWERNYQAGSDVKTGNAIIVIGDLLRFEGNVTKVGITLLKLFSPTNAAAVAAFGGSEVLSKLGDLKDHISRAQSVFSAIKGAIKAGKVTPELVAAFGTLTAVLAANGDSIESIIKYAKDKMKDLTDTKAFKAFKLFSALKKAIDDAKAVGTDLGEAFNDADEFNGKTDFARDRYTQAAANASAAADRFKWELANCDLKRDPVINSIDDLPPAAWQDGSGNGGSSTNVNGNQAVDPNNKIGPTGFDSPLTPEVNDGYIQPGLMPYEIEFENTASVGATVPAQIVIVTDTIDADVDATSIEFTGFGFGSHKFTIPAGLQHYQTTIDLRPDGIDLLVPVRLDFNTETRVLSAIFESLDPVTGLPPEDPFAGFLPVNNASHDGEGFITYTLLPKNGLGTGTTIDNQASIVFDTNAPILTPVTHHTLDVGGPTSQVASLPQTSPANFTVNWSGTDDSGGSGIGVYDIYVSVDGGDFTLWKSAIAETSAIYPGQSGKTYRFYSIARDNVGHIEPATLAADATTTVVDLPPVIENQSFNIAENSQVNAIVGTVQASGSSALTFSILSGNTGNNFILDPTTGSIKVAAGATLNFEGTTTYTLTVQVTDSGSPSKSSSATITIQVTDVNEAPVIPTGQTFNVTASAGTGTVIGTVTANEPDTSAPNSTKNFSLPNGSAIFAINSAGQISVANAAALVAVAGQTVTLQVTDTDGGASPLSATQSVSIIVGPAATAPVLATPGIGAIFYGNLKTPVKVAPTLTVTDADGAATIATILVSLPQGAAKKNPDIITFPGLTAIGTGAVVEANGRKQITITLKPGTTNAAVQTMLQNMTFETKGPGLKIQSRAVKIEVIDQSGLHSNVITQNVVVIKKAPKPPKQPM